MIIYNRQPNWYGAIVCHSENNTKILQERRKELWMGHCDEVKSNPTNCLTFLIVCSIVKEIQNVFLEKNWYGNKAPYSLSNILSVLSGQDCRSCRSSQRRKEVLIHWSELQGLQNFKPCKYNFWSRPFQPKFLAKTQWFYWLYTE